MLYNLQKKLEHENERIKESEKQRFETERQLRKMRSESNISNRRQECENKKQFES